MCEDCAELQSKIETLTIENSDLRDEVKSLEKELVEYGETISKIRLLV